MNALFYHEDNSFLDYDVGNLLKKNGYFVESITNFGNLIATIILLRAKLVIVKADNKYIHDVVEEKYLKDTLFNGVNFVFFDQSKSQDLIYRRSFYNNLERVVENIKNKPQDSYQIFNLDQHLISLGLRPKYRGYLLLKDCIKYCVFLNQYKKLPMSKIYEKVAEKHNTTAKNVERLVRLMLLQSLKKADTKKISEATGIHEEFFKTLPTTNAAIEIICGYLDFYI